MWKKRSLSCQNCEHAGEVLVAMLEPFRVSNSLVLGIPSGGVPVAIVVARFLHLNLDTAVSLQASDLDDQLAQWWHYHNWQRPHGGLNGKTPLCEGVYSKYDPSKERFRSQNCQDDLRLQELKRSP
jgi:integrase-like protein